MQLKKRNEETGSKRVSLQIPLLTCCVSTATLHCGALRKVDPQKQTNLWKADFFVFLLWQIAMFGQYFFQQIWRHSKNPWDPSQIFQDRFKFGNSCHAGLWLVSNSENPCFKRDSRDSHVRGLAFRIVCKTLIIYRRFQKYTHFFN